MKVWRVTISYMSNEDDENRSGEGEIGIFSSADKAKAAIEVILPGLVWEPDRGFGFYAVAYPRKYSQETSYGKEEVIAEEAYIYSYELDELTREFRPDVITIL